MCGRTLICRHQSELVKTITSVIASEILIFIRFDVETGETARTTGGKGGDKVRAAEWVTGTGVQPRVVDFNELWHFYYHY